MELTSAAWENNGSIPRKYSCQGEDISPPLTIKDVPSEAKSLALVMDDPDVPEYLRKDRMWVHWVVYNIDPATTQIDENAHPFGTLGKNTSGETRYMGPCPPDREHRYFFKLYALDIQLKLPTGATKEELLEAMEGHILAETQLIGRYEKNPTP